MKFTVFKFLPLNQTLFDSYEQRTYTKRQILTNIYELWNTDYDGSLYLDHFIAYRNAYLSHVEIPKTDQVK